MTHRARRERFVPFASEINAAARFSFRRHSAQTLRALGLYAPPRCCERSIAARKMAFILV